MNLSRRRAIQSSASLLVFTLNTKAVLAREIKRHVPVRAVAFDAFVIFDPRPAFKLLASQYPEEGEALHKAWFDKVFAYTWLRNSAGRYKSFTEIMTDALAFTAASKGIVVTPEFEEELLRQFHILPVWPDVKAGLARLKAKGIRLAMLSNMTEKMLRANLSANGIEDNFDFILSADMAGQFKPAPAAYQLGVDAFKLSKEHIGFAAFASWDAAGAAWFGYPTCWVNRSGALAEALGPKQDMTDTGFQAVLSLTGEAAP